MNITSGKLSCLTDLSQNKDFLVKDSKMHARKLLVMFLRVLGVSALCALIFVFCPFGWMAAINQWLGLSPLTYTPLTSYLTRTLSAMYASFGVIYLFISFDVLRYLSLIRLIGVIFIVGGVVVAVLDASIKMPFFWTVSEGPFTVLIGLAMILLASRAKR